MLRGQIYLKVSFEERQRNLNYLIVFVNVFKSVTFHLCVNPHLRVFLVRFITQNSHGYSRLPPQMRGKLLFFYQN